MGKYRFKTKQEFVDEGRWDDEHYCPEGWNKNGFMNKHIGKPVPKDKETNCDDGSGFSIDFWFFSQNDYVCISREEPIVEEPINEQNTSKYKVGDEVLISDDSQYYPSQGTFGGDKKLKGIINLLREDGWYQVEWYHDGEFHSQNSYQDKDLIPYEAPLRFKVGDLVVLKESSQYYDEQQTSDENGLVPKTISLLYGDPKSFDYETECGYSYDDDDLDPYVP